MLRKIALLVLVLSVKTASCRGTGMRNPDHSSLRVYNGYDDMNNKYPYVIALIYSIGGRACTGTLIAPEWVLTASHCILHSTPIAEIQYGNMTVPSHYSKSKSKILRTMPHPLYKPYFQNRALLKNDIALLKVEAVRLQTFGKLSALDYQSINGQIVQYAGYGTTHYQFLKNHRNSSTTDATRQLQLGDGLTVACDSKEYDLFLCIAPKCSTKHQDTMAGDSGCPLFHDGKIIGVLMGGYRRPISMFTPVSRYIPWITKVMNREKDV